MAFAQPTVSGVLAGRRGVRSFAPTAPTAPTADPFQRTQVADDAFISNLFRQFQAPVSFEQPFEQQAEQALMQPQQVFGPARSVPQQNPIVPAANIVRNVANIGAQFTDSPQLQQVSNIAGHIGTFGALTQAQNPAQAAAALAPAGLRLAGIGGPVAGGIAGAIQGLARGDVGAAAKGAALGAIGAAVPPLGIAMTVVSLLGSIFGGSRRRRRRREHEARVASLPPEQREAYLTARQEQMREAQRQHEARLAGMTWEERQFATND